MKIIQKNSTDLIIYLVTLVMIMLLVSVAVAQEKTSLVNHNQELATPKANCPKLVYRSGLPEGTDAEILSLEYWRERWAEQFNLDEPLLESDEIEEHNEVLASGKNGVQGQISLSSPLELSKINTLTKGRLKYMLDLFDRGEYIKRGAGALSPEEYQRFEMTLTELNPSTFRVALSGIQILCGPFKGEIQRVNWDLSIDRNACTQIRPQALVQVIGEWDDQLLLIRTRLAMGWIPKDAPLSPPVPPQYLHHYLNGPFGHAPRSVYALDQKGLLITAEARAPLINERALIATQSGFELWSHQGKLKPIPDALTRGEVLKRLFSHLNKRYGLGGMGGNIDCSRVIIDSLEPFGFKPPRYSGHQARMGSWSVDISKITDQNLRESILDTALTRGFTILYIPGHMMVYLGRDHLGIPRSFHALSDYQRVCQEGGESTVDIKQVTITDLRRGEGSTKGAYLDRITRVVVLGNSGPGAQLRALASGLITERPRRPVIRSAQEQCPQLKSKVQLRLSSLHLSADHLLQVVITHPSMELFGHLTLFGPQGLEHELNLTKFSGVPEVLYGQKLGLEPGSWRAVFGEGHHWQACQDFIVTPQLLPLSVPNEATPSHP